MTVAETRRAFPHDAWVQPEDSELLPFDTYLVRNKMTPKEFTGVLKEMGTGNDLWVSHGTITSIGPDDWPGDQPREGKSAYDFIRRGGVWKVRVEDNDSSVNRYFAAYPEKEASFSGTWLHEDYSAIRFDVWSFETSITFKNGLVVSANRVEVPD